MPRLTDDVLSHLDDVLSETTTQSELTQLETATFALDGPLVRVADRFEITATIARGGMSEVYRARDLQSGLEVALKVQHVGEPWLDARFEREVNALAELDHPRLVRHVGHGRSLEGVLWLATELLAGETLAELLTRGRLSLPSALGVARDVVGALGVLHGRGFVHRDVKPGNVYVELDGHAKLLDLGLLGARGGEASGASGAALTATGALLGTIGYLSPEQARGERAIGPTADFFALGCVLFECLAGTPPFGRSLAETTAAYAMGAEPSLAKLPGEVPEAARELIGELLQLAPERRPQTAALLERRLDLLLAEQDRTRSPGAAPSGGGGIDELMGSTLTLEGGGRPAGAALPFVTPIARPAAPALRPQGELRMDPPPAMPLPPLVPRAPPPIAAARAAPAAPAASLVPAAASPVEPPRERIDLLWYDPALVDVILHAPIGVEMRAEDDTRRAVARVLATGRPSALEELHDRYAQVPSRGHTSSLALVGGTLELGFEIIDRLRATLALVTPFVTADRQLSALCDAGRRALEASASLPSSAAAAHVEGIEARLRQLARSSKVAVTATVDQALIESRSFVRCRVFGGSSIRALLTPAGTQEAVPTYLADAAADELPLLRTIPIRAVVEIRPQQQAVDLHPFALRVLALARVVERRR